VIFADTNILLRLDQTSAPEYPIVENALNKLRLRQEVLCIAPQNLVEYWVVATRPQRENGFGLTPARASAEITKLLRLFRLLPYSREVFETWQRIVAAQGIIGRQAHDAHLVAMMQVHSVMSVLTFNIGHFTRFPGITVIDPAQV
jgi:predicted nucleic acid-binding protein